MAQKRMFSKKITDTDQFLDMPLSAQALYFHLNMHADDDGFVDSVKTIKRMIGSSDDDLKLLLNKQFIFAFNSGVVVIKDWKIHNYIRKDTYNSTSYEAEKAQLSEDSKGAYTFRRRTVDESSTQVRLDKVSKDKNRLEEDKENLPAKADSIPYQKIVDHLNEKTGQHFQAKAKETRKLIKARINDGFTPDQLIQAIDNQVACWKGKTNEKYLRPATLFKQSKFEERVNGGVPDPSDFKNNQKPDTYKNNAWDDYEKKFDELATQYQQQYGEVPVNLDDMLANPNLKPKFKADEERELAEMGITSDDLPF